MAFPLLCSPPISETSSNSARNNRGKCDMRRALSHLMCKSSDTPWSRQDGSFQRSPGQRLLKQDEHHARVCRSSLTINRHWSTFLQGPPAVNLKTKNALRFRERTVVGLRKGMCGMLKSQSCQIHQENSWGAVHNVPTWAVVSVPPILETQHTEIRPPQRCFRRATMFDCG